MRNLHSIWLLVLLAGTSFSVHAQLDTLSAPDQRLLATLLSELQPTAAQRNGLEESVKHCAMDVQKLEAEKSRLNKESEDEALLATKLKVISQQIKDRRQERDLEIQSLLDERQLAIYNEKIKPSRPQVLHFGLHNRADCKVCTQ